MLSSLKSFILIAFIVAAGVLAANAQETNNPQIKVQEKSAKEVKKDSKPAKADPSKGFSAEQVAESVLLIYSGFRGREGMKQIRKTAIERGKINITNPDGTVDQANYEKRILRGDSLNAEKIRFDQEFPTAKYALIYNDSKIVGVFNDSVFTPREDASKSFQNQIGMV